MEQQLSLKDRLMSAVIGFAFIACWVFMAIGWASVQAASL